MAQNRLSSGKRLTVTSPGTISGLGVLIGSLFGIAETTSNSGDLVDINVGGEWTHASDTGTTWAVGDVVYWDNTAKVFTKTATSNTKQGVASAVKSSTAATGSVRLYPQI